MDQASLNIVRNITEIAEALPERGKAILLSYGEGFAAAASLYRPPAGQSAQGEKSA